MRHVAETLVDPDEFLGRGWTAGVTGRLAAVPNWTARWAIIDDVLARRLAEGPVPSPAVAQSWDWLLASNGRVTMTELAEATGRSSRRLQVLFLEQIGLPAKSVARILRFQRAVTQLANQSFALTAAACGYHDQAHLIRDFQALAGLTPTRFRELTRNAIPGGAAITSGRLTDITTYHNAPVPPTRRSRA
jgi:AraC-like DNA-binding protein